MKKILSVLLMVVVLATVFTACGKKETVETPDKEVLKAEETVKQQEEVKEEKEEKKEEKKEEVKKEEPKKEETTKEEPKKEEPKKEEVKEEPVAPKPVDLNAAMNKILSGVETPVYEVLSLDKESFSAFLFTDYVDGVKAVTADSLIGSIAHSVCLVEVPSGVSASEMASKIKANADPRKWICVEAEKVIVEHKNNLILLVMSNEDTANKIAANFKAL